MYNYQLLPKLRHLVLAGKNEEGELEWIGSEKQWQAAKHEEDLIIDQIINQNDF